MVATGSTYILAIVFIVGTPITGLQSNDVIYRNGCFKGTQFTAVDNTVLPNNFPGTCLAYCKRQGHTSMYTALQGEICACVNQTTNVTSSGCNVTCPGHDAHFCGNAIIGVSSLYRIDYNTNSTESTRCVTFTCRNTFRYEDCSKTHKVFCVKDVNIADDCTLPEFSPGNVVNGSWDEAINTCAGASDSIQYTCISMNKGFHPVCSNCKSGIGVGHAIFWIGGFGQWAPPKKCSPNATEMIKDSRGIVLDEHTVYFNCNGVNTTLHCLGNGSWSGTKPHCTDEVRATTTTSTKTTTSATTTTTTTTTTPPLTTTIITTTTIPQTVASEKTIFNVTASPKGDTDSSPLGMIIGMCVGILVFAVLIAVIVVCIYKRKCKKQREVAPTDRNPQTKVPGSVTLEDKAGDTIDNPTVVVETSKLPRANFFPSIKSDSRTSPETLHNASTNDSLHNRLPPLNPHFLSTLELLTTGTAENDNEQTEKTIEHKKKKRKKKKKSKKKNHVDHIDGQHAEPERLDMFIEKTTENESDEPRAHENKYYEYESENKNIENHTTSLEC